MILTHIWERFIFKEGLKILLFFLLSFYTLYVLIDYSVHSRHFSHAHFSFADILFYYTCHFTKRAVIIVPFAQLLATLKVLFSINTTRELIALLAGGIPLHKIIHPLLVLATFCMAFLYINAQFLGPWCDRELQAIEESYTSVQESAPEKRLVNHISMKDGSTLVFQYYDSKKQAFFDVFWIQNSNTITRMKYLYPEEKVPTGLFVDRLIRNKEGRFVLVESLPEYAFKNMHLDEELIQETLTPPMQESLSFLLTKFGSANYMPALTYKLLMPLIALFAVLIPAPYCLRFRRNLPIFLLYAAAIFGFFTFVTIIGALFIVSENGLVHPFIAIGIPFLCFSLYSIKNYLSLK